MRFMTDLYPLNLNNFICRIFFHIMSNLDLERPIFSFLNLTLPAIQRNESRKEISKYFQEYKSVSWIAGG